MHDAPDMHGAECMAELPFDQLANTRQRPQFGRKAAGDGPRHQHLAQLGPFGWRHRPGTTEWLASPSLGIGGQHLRPTRCGLPAHLAGPGDLGLRHAPIEQAHAAAPALFELLEIPLVPFRCHGSASKPQHFE